MKNTLAIAYNGGAYGTYLEWAINTLLDKNEIESPFTSVGNSHNSKLGCCLEIQNIEEYLNSNNEPITFRFHPKTEKFRNLKKNLEMVMKDVKGLILLYPDRSLELMAVCNLMTKIWQGDFFDGAMKYVDPKNLHEGWNIDPKTDLRTIPIWMRREHMSLNLFNSWHDQVEWYFPDTWSHPKAMIITTKQLFDDFESVLQHISARWDINFHKPIKRLMPYHSKMISLQSNYGKDKICTNILSSLIFEGTPMVWDDLCLVSQAWLQYQLRNHGYELKCHDLNEFPRDSQTLKDLIYKVC